MEYIKGRNNLACTIFFPMRCGNNCPFCNTKQMYDGFELDAVYLAKIHDSIRIANESDAVREFVITGGEPLISLDLLKTIVGWITPSKPIYINTSLPNVSNIDDCIEYINTEGKIRGINISRHLGNTHSVKVCSKNKIDKIIKSKRINCLIKPEYVLDTFDESPITQGTLQEFIKYYGGDYTMINFRADYRNITPDTLKNNDIIHQWMLKNFRYEGANGCLVCNSEFFSNDDEVVICYHRGLENSLVVTEKYSYVNDVLIDIYGNMYPNWDMKHDENFITWLKNYKETELV